MTSGVESSNSVFEGQGEIGMSRIAVEIRDMCVRKSEVSLCGGQGSVCMEVRGHFQTFVW